MSTLKNVAVNTVVVYGGKLLGIIISTLTLGIVARYLGVEGYGDYSAVISYSAVVIAIADLGIGWLTTREIALGNTQRLVLLKSLKITATVVAIIVSLALLPVLLYRPNVSLGIVLIIFYTYVTSLNSLQVGILQGYSELKKTVYADTGGRLVNLILAYGVAYFDLGIQAQFLALNLVGLTVYGVNAYMISTVTKPVKGFALQGVGELKRDLLTLPLVSAISYLVYRVDMLILAKLASAIDVGIYASAYRIIDVAVAVPSILVGTLLPLFTQVIHGNDAAEREKVFRFGYVSTFLVGGLAASCCIAFAEPVIRLVMGQDYVTLSTQIVKGVSFTAVQILQILGLFLYLSFIGSLLSGVILAAKRQHMMIVIGSIALFVTVVGNFLLIGRFSYVASGFLTVFTELCLVIGMIIALYKTGWLKDFWAPLVRSLFATAITMVLFFEVFSHWHLVVQAFAVPAVYLGISVIVGVKEREVLMRAIRKITMRSQQ